MQLVSDLSKGVADEFREKKKGKLKRTFVQASDAAGAKIKGVLVISTVMFFSSLYYLFDFKHSIYHFILNRKLLL